MIAFMIWSIVAVIFLGMGISCQKSGEAVGFFTFVKPPAVNDIRKYNHAICSDDFDHCNDDYLSKD